MNSVMDYLLVVTVTSVLAGLYLRKRAIDSHNAQLYVLYMSMAEAMTSELDADAISWDIYVDAINSARDVYNEGLRGRSKKKMWLPKMQVTKTTEAGVKHGTQRRRRNRTQGQKPQGKIQNPPTR